MTQAARSLGVSMGTLFRPASQCDPTCLSSATDTVGPLREFGRVVAALVVLLAAAAVGAFIGAFPKSAQPRAARRLLRHTAVWLLRAFGIAMTTTGPDVPERRALVVANHVSWLDIIAMQAVADVRMVAKNEVASWPVVGRLARLSGTIFIDRERPTLLPATIAEIRDALSAGDVVGAFPEGTTSCGFHAVPYRPAIFQAAIDADASVTPMALHYRAGDGELTPDPAFIGDETLMMSLRRVLAMRSLRIDVRVGGVVRPQPGMSRGELVRITESVAS